MGVTFPNFVLIVLLSGVVAHVTRLRVTRLRFERRPWEENALIRNW